MTSIIDAKLLKKEIESLQVPNETTDACFIRWYLDVRLGSHGSELFISDGPSDGGIDAIRYPARGDKKVIIVQSYFADLNKPKRIPRNKLENFLEFPELINDRAFIKEWLKENVRENLQNPYSQLFNKIRRGALDPEWMFLTSANSTPLTKKIVNRVRNRGHKAICIDRNDILRAFALYKEGAAPPDDPLVFRFEGQPLIHNNKGPATAVYAARLDDILKYVKSDSMLRLFSRNVRLRIQKSKINEGIKDTFRRSPNEFLMSHNGLTIICSNSSISHGNVTLEQPNVVNGAQTLLTLKNERSSGGRANILVRVIDVGDYAKNMTLIRDIVIRSNTQNAIQPPDLVACDERQVEIERYFRSQGRIYIRRRGQEVLEMGPRAGKQIQSVNLAKVLACCDSRVGVWAAGHSKNALFQEEYYKYLFEAPTFDEIFAKYRLYEVLDEARRKAPKTKRSRFRYAWRNVLSAAWNIIDSDIDIRREIVKNKLLLNVSLKARENRTLAKMLREMYEYSWSLYEKARSRNPDLLPHKYFFGEKDRAGIIVHKIQNKFSKQLNRELIKLSV